jgi:hypothetical protein
MTVLGSSNLTHIDGADIGSDHEVSHLSYLQEGRYRPRSPYAHSSCSFHSGAMAVRENILVIVIWTLCQFHGSAQGINYAAGKQLKDLT